MKIKKYLVINGPSINLIGFREPEIYGHETYIDLLGYLKNLAKEKEVKIKVEQSNSEGAIIDLLQIALLKQYDGIIINPGAYAHYSYAIKDAIASLNMNVVEVHLTDVESREDFRKNLVTASACDKCFYGKHFESYKDALEYLLEEQE